MSVGVNVVMGMVVLMVRVSMGMAVTAAAGYTHWRSPYLSWK